MKETRIYNVAGHCFAVTADAALLGKMEQYAPFVVEGSAARDGLVFTLTVADGGTFPDVEVTEEMRQDDDGSQIVAGHTADGRAYFEFLLFGRRSARMLVSGTGEACIWINAHVLFGLNNGLMVMYALSTARRRTALFHSSVVSHQGRAYMFLGKSGTGKSTHSSLWLKYISGTALVNDDNPVVRVLDDGTAWVYGSPWSGKTPCYRNVSLPLGGIVNLSQAPYNAIKPLKGVEAYAALLTSISGKRWDSTLADGLHDTEEWLVQHAGMWHLECLPDEEAALLCCKTVSQD